MQSSLRLWCAKRTRIVWSHIFLGPRFCWPAPSSHAVSYFLFFCFYWVSIEQIASNFIYLLQHGDFLNEICFWTFSLLFISNFTTYKGRLICQFHEAQVMDRCYLFTFKSYPTSFEDGPLSRWNEIWTLWFVRMSVLITTTLEYSLVNTKVRFFSVQTQTTRPKFASQMEAKHGDVPRFLKNVRANTLRSKST